MPHLMWASDYIFQKDYWSDFDDWVIEQVLAWAFNRLARLKCTVCKDAEYALWLQSTSESSKVTSHTSPGSILESGYLCLTWPSFYIMSCICQTCICHTQCTVSYLLHIFLHFIISVFSFRYVSKPSFLQKWHTPSGYCFLQHLRLSLYRLFHDQGQHYKLLCLLYHKLSPLVSSLDPCPLPGSPTMATAVLFLHGSNDGSLRQLHLPYGLY